MNYPPKNRWGERIIYFIPGYSQITRSGITKLQNERDKPPLNNLPPGALDAAISNAEHCLDKAEAFAERAANGDDDALDLYVAFNNDARRHIQLVRREAMRPAFNTGQRVRTPFRDANKHRQARAAAESERWQAEAERLWSTRQHADKSKSEIARLIAPENWNNVRRRITKP